MNDRERATDWKSRWRACVAAAGCLLAITGLVAVGIWRTSHRPLPQPKTAPVGVSSEWKCEGAGAKDGGFCWRELPPAKPRR